MIPFTSMTYIVLTSMTTSMTTQPLHPYFQQTYENVGHKIKLLNNLIKGGG
jgi:hypothetical protein